MRSTAGKLAVVTGGISGIGLALSRELTAAGMSVVATYRRRSCLLEAMPRLRGTDIEPFVLDVTDRRAVACAAEDIATKFGKLHVLCNNAGVNRLGLLDEATHADWDRILNVNLFGVVNCLVSFLPKIKAHGEGGHVLNVASMSAFIPSLRAGVYTASKFAVRGLTECLRLTLAQHGIGVSLLCPGLTRSNIWQPKSGLDLATEGNESTRSLAEIHAKGMDPTLVAARAVQGILRNEFYIFTHPEFADELSESTAEIMSAVPRGVANTERLAVERQRIAAKAHARAVSDAL